MNALLGTCISSLTIFIGGIWFLHQIPVFPLATPSSTVSAPTHVSIETKHPKMWVISDTLSQGETLGLYFRTPNAPYLGVIDPKGHFFYIVYPGESGMGELRPFVESNFFTALTALQLNTSSFKADPYTYGIYANQPVFTCTGTYTFILGENLHVDEPDMLNKVTIHYTHNISSPGSLKAPTPKQVNLNPLGEPSMTPFAYTSIAQ